MPSFVIVAFLIILITPTTPVLAADYIAGSGCSVSNEGYLTELAREYERRTGVRVLVRGGGSAVGIDDLRSGKVDFAASCRSREKDDPQDVQFVQVAWDALVFIVHPSNTVSSVTAAQIHDILMNRIRDWKQLKGRDGRIKLFISRARIGLSGVESSTKSLILQGKEPVESPDTLFLASTGIVEQMVEKTPDGFAVTGFSSAQKRAVKLLKVNGVKPTVKNIISGAYPYRRPLFILLPHSPKPEVQRFVDYILSKEGQKFIRSQNVVSLLDVP
ncbi:MAG: phosphate ABC transporter substrate-binding protein [Nitrospiraceae bacterium]|nr:phosphate ABC transporter substrate-binding protein [Nitrospiraceae bacterium]